MEKSYFDGESFESHGIVIERIHDDLPAMREEMEPYPGRHGSRVNSLTLNSREITLECRFLGDRWGDFETMKDDVAEWVVTDSDRPLALRNHPGQHYMAHYTSFTEGDRLGTTGIGGFEMVFTASDPIRYGEDRAFVLSGTGQQQFEVGGTDEADMAISVRGATRNASSKLWGITMNGSAVKVALADSRQHSIDVDLRTHTVRVDGALTGVTLDSEWPEVAPGRWRVTISQGTGTATFSWTQRYR